MATQKHKSIKTLLRTAINSRILFNSKSEAEEYLGITDLDNVKSESKLFIYYSELDKKCKDLCGYSLEELVDSYSKAVEKYNEDPIGFSYTEKKKNNGITDESDTDRRRRSESRRLLAVKLFIWTYLNQTKTGRNKAQSPINNRVAYSEKSFEAYFSTETEEELIDVCFTVLLHWDIVKPYGSNTSDYNKDSPNKDDRRNKMLNLLNSLKEEIPDVGIFSAGNLPALNMAFCFINNSLANESHPTTAEYWLMLRQIGSAAFFSSQKSCMEVAGLETYSLRMPGIWTDNVDEGKSRFWVFPDNCYYAFCYQKTAVEKWEISIYECFVCSYKNNEDKDYIVWTDAEESRKTILNYGRGCDGDKISYLYFETKHDEDDEICDLYLTPIKEYVHHTLPFSEFHRLSAKDPRHDMAKNQISMSHTAEERHLDMVNLTNALLATDQDYIYLYDYDLEHIPFAMQVVDCYGDFIRYHYATEAKKEHIFQRYNLCNVGNRPNVIRIPRNIESHGWNRIFSSVPDLYDRLKYALDNIDMNGMVTIYNFGTDDKHKIIFFNDFSVGFSIEQLKATLIKKDDKIKASLLHWINCESQSKH